MVIRDAFDFTRYGHLCVCLDLALLHWQADASRCDERRRSHEAIIDAAAAIEAAKVEKARAAAEREAALAIAQQKQMRVNLAYSCMAVLAVLLAIVWRVRDTLL